jgi:hypothetical protein
MDVVPYIEARGSIVIYLLAFELMNELVEARELLQVVLCVSNPMCSCVIFLSQSLLYAFHLGEMLAFEALSLPVNA